MPMIDWDLNDFLYEEFVEFHCFPTMLDWSSSSYFFIIQDTLVELLA